MLGTFRELWHFGVKVLPETQNMMLRSLGSKMARILIGFPTQSVSFYYGARRTASS